MAHAVQLIDPTTNQIGFAYKGFSWTSLFFGPFPALFRGHFSAFFIMAIIDMASFGVAALIFPFFYNGWHFNRMIKKGYRLPGMHLGTAATSHNVINVTVGMEKPATA